MHSTNALMANAGAARTMSSRDIAELTEKNHADVLALPKEGGAA